ncbi:MAG: carbohydrate-binding domain-containing protein [Nocardioides sp.]|uniref:carbohydrate-binding domain-containing protein n=1 Tax=Nocardioides sp. TaxID=35761 RepID=UPI003EFDD0B7
MTGRFNNGIVAKDGLVISGGTIEVDAVDDGIIGKDYLVLRGGDVTVDAEGDGVKSDNDTDAGSGFVLVEGGSLEVSSADDGIKGLEVLMSGGEVVVVESVEALEGALVVIDDGSLELHSADDGINVASSDDSASTDGAPGGEMAADSSLHLVINGGTIEVFSSGDGLDSNGDAVMTGGEVTVHGPTTDGNGAIDVNGTFLVSGGTLVAHGSAGMMVAPSADSEQGWIATALATTASAGDTVSVSDAYGTELATYVLDKDSASLVLSSSDIEAGETYVVSVEGTETTVVADEAPAGGGMGAGPMG